MTSSTKGEIVLRSTSKLLCLATLLLILVGGMVTSTGSGLAIPDWPTTYGYSMFRFPLSHMAGGIACEQTHRMVAAGVGIATLLLACGIPFLDKRRWMQWLGFVALGAVVLQGLLGGTTVLLELPLALSVAHGVLAQTFLAIAVILAYGLSVERRRRLEEEQVPPAHASFIKLAAAVAACVYLQLVLGAVMRHTQSGYIAHYFGALCVVVAVLTLNIDAHRRRPASSRVKVTLQLLNVLLVTQWLLSLLAIWTNKAPFVTSLHVAAGAAVLGVSALLLLRACPVRSAREYTQAIDAGGATAGLQAAPQTLLSSAQACLELAKLRIVSMVLVTTTIGYFLGSAGHFHGGLLLITLLGTGFAAAGAAVLNNYLERDIDARMLRTRQRALPSGRIDPAVALAYGILLVLGGVGLLVWSVNLLTGFIVLLTAFLYVLVYTPLKQVTWLNTPIGAIPGALPPMVGWAAAQGQLELGAWLLFAILFIWQHPHFYSIAWMFKDDYKRAGFKMLSVVDPSGRQLFLQTILFAVALLIVSLTLPFCHMTGSIYFYGALVIGIVMLSACLGFARSRTRSDARRVLLTSVIYLPLLLLLIVIDSGLLHLQAR